MTEKTLDIEEPTAFPSFEKEIERSPNEDPNGETPLESSSLVVEQGDSVLTKDGKTAVVTLTVKVEPEDDPPYKLIDAVVLEVVNGQPKLSAIKRGKYGEDWKWPHEE